MLRQGGSERFCCLWRTVWRCPKLTHVEDLATTAICHGLTMPLPPPTRARIQPRGFKQTSVLNRHARHHERASRRTHVNADTGTGYSYTACTYENRRIRTARVITQGYILFSTHIVQNGRGLDLPWFCLLRATGIRPDVSVPTWSEARMPMISC